MLILVPIWLACAVACTEPAPVVRIDRDNIELTSSCIVEIDPSPILDVDGNGVIHVSGDDLTISFKAGSNHLHGATKDQAPDSFIGVGLVLRGKNITIKNATVSGFKVGIHAIGCDGLTIDQLNVSNNFRQRLKSTPQSEDASDWLWPHANDDHEWITRYGAGVCVENSSQVTLTNITAHHGQNGIIFDRVSDSRVYDCDCLFLSGWGLALWRSSRNVISRNAFDFCIRGYSHGVYNRGQDSAGILMFEQCCENIFVENSATHCGDGYFGFAGKEALGEVNPRQDVSWYKNRGCNENQFHKNDFSYAAAHGLELTFSFGNRAWDNTFTGNAICGIWGGYSQSFIIDHNRFAHNGDGANGNERGGINIEHGKYNMIGRNRFESDACGISLWWDEDKSLLSTPWARANDPRSTQTFILENEFAHMPIAVQLRHSSDLNVADNTFDEVATHIDADEQTSATLSDERALDLSHMKLESPQVLGTKHPVGARKHLAGREKIIMTQWGPWDHQSPLLQYLQRFDRADQYQLRGMKTLPTSDQISFTGDVFVDVQGDRLFVRPTLENTILPYTFSFDADGHHFSAAGTLSGGAWEVWTFASACDPREDAERWRREGTANHHTLTADDLDFRFGSRGMSEVRGLPIPLPRDHFGIIATRTLAFPPGRWRVRTLSDDGVRVWLDDALAIDDWTWHGPTEHVHEFEAADARTVSLRVEYFELDGHAVLSVQFEPI